MLVMVAQAAACPGKRTAMRIPMRVDYGVRALVDLALQVQGDRPVRTAT